MIRALILILATALVAGCDSGQSPPAAAPAADISSAADAPKGVAWNWAAPSPAGTGMPAADDREVAFTWGHEHLESFSTPTGGSAGTWFASACAT